MASFINLMQDFLISHTQVRVPWRNIGSSAVQIQFEGIELLLTPQVQSNWEFIDIFSPEYLQTQLEAMIADVILDNQTETQQSYFDSIKLKILDNIKVKVSDVHIRIEHFFHLNYSDKDREYSKQASFGILFRSFEVCTTDKEGNDVFYDRTKSKKETFKQVSLQGLAVYLNPYDAMMIHKLPTKSKQSEITFQMRKCIQRYIELTDLKEGDDKRVLDDPSLIYILRPLSLKILIERKTEKPEHIKVQITLDSFSLQFLYNQLNAMLVFSKLAQKYQQKANEQEKVKKFRFLRQPVMDAEAKWLFAIECIRRSIRTTKRGALTAFTIQQSKLKEFEDQLKPRLIQFYQTPDLDKLKLFKSWQEKDRLIFWHILSVVEKKQMQIWIKEAILPIIRKQEVQKENDEGQSGGGWLSWIYGGAPAQKKEESDDDLDEFFDCEEELPEVDGLGTRDRTSIEVIYEVKELTLLLAKIKQQNKLEGIQMYNKGAIINFRSPNLKFDEFVCEVNFMESGVDLVTIDRSTGQYQDCTSAIQQNKRLQNSSTLKPQLTLEVKKGGKALLKDGIAYDINLQVGSIIYKHYEDLIIRAKAISNIKVDQEIQSAAMGTIEDLRENAQNRLYELMYKNKNRYVLSLESPVLIIPINATFEGKNSPVWVINTGNMLIISQNQDKTIQSQVIEKIHILQKSKLIEEDVYEAYKINVTSIGLHYYSQFSLYQKSLSVVNQLGQSVKAKMPERFHEFSIYQQEHLNIKQSVQKPSEFSVLEDFEIRMLMKTLKSQKNKTSLAPKLDIDVQTTSIRINLSHSIFNQGYNFSNIFKISKEKQAQFMEEENSYNQKIKEEVYKQLILEGPIRRLKADTVIWEENHAVISGRWLYFFKDKQATTYLDYLQLDNAECTQNGQQISISYGGYKHVFLPRDHINWKEVIDKQILNLNVKNFNDQNMNNLEREANRRRNDLKRKAANPEQINMQMKVKMTSLELKLLRMMLMPGTRIIQQPAAFEQWVTIGFQGMQMTQIQREYDDEKIIKFQQITMIDVTMPFLHQVLVSQTTTDGQEASLVIKMNKIKEQSSKFKGLLDEMEVNMKNVNFKFMPGSINQVIKLLRSTKLQKLKSQQQEEIYEQNNMLETMYEDEDLLLSKRKHATFEMTAEEEKEKEIVTQKYFETTCGINKVQTSRIAIVVDNGLITMLHHKYTMPLFSLDAQEMYLEMADWYDHSELNVKYKFVKLCDLSNHPYTIQPQQYHEQVLKSITPNLVQPNLMMSSDNFDLSYQSYSSQKCSLKNQDFNNKLVMRISPFRINYVQEVQFRFIEYFQQRFMDTFIYSDPYKNPKEEFEARQKRQGIPIDKMNSKTDFGQLPQVDFYDIQILNAKIFTRDRPFSQNYILISSPKINVTSSKIVVNNKFPLKPEIQLGMQRYNIDFQTINFWYGISKKKRDRLSLLKETFNIKIVYDQLLWSELLEKIDVRQMDKSTNVSIEFDPLKLVLPQAVYTFMLRCNDLNFMWTDQLAKQFYCVKWIHMADLYKQFKKVVQQKVNLVFPIFSLELKHTDGSFIAQLLLKQFNFSMTRFLDGASDQFINCENFFILDQQDLKQKDALQAIVCPWHSPLVLDPIKKYNNADNERHQEAQLSIIINNKATGDAWQKDIQLNITGLKIFVKMTLFIMLKGYFDNAWPKYRSDDIDKPVGFVGNDPDNFTRQSLKLKIHKSLICLLNQPGFKSIAMLGEFEFQTLSENISEIKKQFNSMGLVRHESVRRSGENLSHTEEIITTDIVYTMKISVSQLTPYILSLSNLESGEVDFSEINKRQLFSPLDMQLTQNYQLQQEIDEDYLETGKFGVNTKTVIQIGQLQLKISILDLHLILQVTAYASEQMAKETVQRLQQIEKNIDQEYIKKMRSEEIEDVENQLNKSKDKKRIKERKQKFFVKLMNKFQESKTDSMQTVMARLSQTTEQFQRLTQGYTGQTYNERETFLQFVTKDILKIDNEKIDQINQNIIQEDEQKYPQNILSDESEDDDDHKPYEQASYFNLVKSERQKSVNLSYRFQQSAQNSQLASLKSQVSTPSQRNIASKISSNLNSFKKEMNQPSSTKSKKSSKSSAGNDSDQDDFKSALSSLEEYEQQKEAAVEKFFSFHEKREIIEEDVPMFGDFEKYQVTDSIRETLEENRVSQAIDSESDEEESFEVQQLQNIAAKVVLSDAPEIKSTMQNVIIDLKVMHFDQISVLAINDYNCGFTPVLQLDFTQIEVNQRWQNTKESDVGLVLKEIFVNYYNIELGEWEPLLEPTSLQLNQQLSLTDSKTTITMKDPINLNSTQECLKNLFYTYESWMLTPQFFQKPPSDRKKELKKSKIINNSNLSDSEESDQDQNFNGYQKKNNRVFINQMRETVIEPNQLLKARESKDVMLFPVVSVDDDDILSETYVQIKQNNQNAVTPFSIANYTSRTIKIVRGGIKPGNFHEIKVYQNKEENEQIYVLTPSTETDYAVTYDKLMGNKDQTVTRDSVQMDLRSARGEDDYITETETRNAGSEVDEVVRKLQKIKNNEIIGIQLSELDYVPYVDLNRNTGQNPWVHEISPSTSEKIGLNLKPNPIDTEVPLLQDYKQIPEEEPVQNLIRFKVFYGTLLKGMRKFLIIRSPYCIVNKTSFTYEIRIVDSRNKQMKHQQKLMQGESMGIDDLYYQGHQIQLKLTKNNSDIGIERASEAQWSQRVQITLLLKMPTDEGTGIFVSSADLQEVTTCIKHQSGEINGTSDFVLLPPITIKNCLPCSIVLRQRVKLESHKSLAHGDQHQLDHHKMEQSQEKEFHVFSPVRTQKEDEFQLEIGLDGFLFVPIDLKVSQNAISNEEDLEISDIGGNKLTISLRKQYTKAGFHLILFAHVVILVETLQVLPIMNVFYYSSYRDPRPLANQEEMAERKYIMCNKESDITIGIKDQLGVRGHTFSQGLDLKEAGKKTFFSVMSQPGANINQVNLSRYDFVCTTNLQMADFEDQIYTKVVQITPAYVICNMTNSPIEIAQANNIEAMHPQQRILQVSEKKEWYWPTGNLPDTDLKIILRKIQPIIEFDEKSQNRYSISDRVRDWEWSRPISLFNIQDQISFPQVIFEKQGSRRKIYLIGKKIVGSTTFITIREEKPPIQSTYLIRNLCPNLRLSFQQDEQPFFWKLNENESTSYAHLDPQARVLSVTFNLTIDKSFKRFQFKNSSCFEKQIPFVLFDNDFDQYINYEDNNNKIKTMNVMLRNDGLTKCLTFSLTGETKKKQVQQIQNKQESTETLKRSSLIVSLSWLTFSIVGYTRVPLKKKSAFKKGFQTKRQRNEIALFSMTGFNFANNYVYESGTSSINLEIHKFQVDNQSSQNPLFPTILQKKDNSLNSAPFIMVILKYCVNQETNIKVIEFFQAEFSSYIFKLDDSFLTSILETVQDALALNKTNKQNVHPLFMKDCFYDRSKFLEQYLARTFETDSEKFEKKEISNRKRAATVKNQLIGIVTVGEIKFNQKIEDIPQHFRHWIMQDNMLEEQAKLEVRNFNVGKLVLEITFIFRTKSFETKEKDSSINYIKKSGLKLASIDELTLNFDPYTIQNKFMAQHDFQQGVNTFYYEKAKSSVLKAILQIKLIGSIPSCLGHMGDGLYSFIQIPREGFQKTWYQGVGGCFLGFGVLFKETFIGLLGSIQVISESWSEMSLTICQDDDYAIEHEEEVLTERPKNFVEGLGYGARSALISIPNAAIGFFTRPVIESTRSGVKGFIFGLWQGTSGIFLKPISGGFDLFAKTSEGFKNTLRIFEQKQKKGRVRMPRTFYGIQRRIKAFSEDDAFIVSNVLCQIKRGEFATDHYIDMKLIRTASENRAPHFLLLSEENLFLIEASQKALVWHIEQKHIVKIQNMSNGLLIHLKENEDYAGRAYVGLPLDGASSVEINEWFGHIMSDQI